MQSNEKNCVYIYIMSLCCAATFLYPTYFYKLMNVFFSISCSIIWNPHFFIVVGSISFILDHVTVVAEQQWGLYFMTFELFQLFPTSTSLRCITIYLFLAIFVCFVNLQMRVHIGSWAIDEYWHCNQYLYTSPIKKNMDKNHFTLVR